MKELFEPVYLFEQLFSFVRIFDTNPVIREILQQRPIMYIRAGEDRLLAALERLMFHQLNAVAVVDECVAGDSCFLLVRF